MRFFTFLILSFLTIPTIAALAAEEMQLRYHAPSNDIRELSVTEQLKADQKLVGDLPFTLTEVDLNNDGVPEWVFRQERTSHCETTASCVFLVVGLKEKKPVLLGEFTGSKVNLTDHLSYGVRGFSLYTNPNNDLAAAPYDWNPYKGAYGPRL